MRCLLDKINIDGGGEGGNQFDVKQRFVFNGLQTSYFNSSDSLTTLD